MVFDLTPRGLSWQCDGLSPDNQERVKIPNGAWWEFPREGEREQQLRLQLGYRTAMTLRRAYGLVGSIKREESVNTRSPYLVTAVLKLPWWSYEDGERVHVFCRATAFGSTFAPRAVSLSGKDSFEALRVGDPVVGVLDGPAGHHRGAQLLGWSYADTSEWRHLSPKSCWEQEEIDLDPNMIYHLPQLGGLCFKDTFGATALPAVRMYTPVYGVESFRSIVRTAGAVSRVDQNLRMRSEADILPTELQRGGYRNPSSEIPLRTYNYPNIPRRSLVSNAAAPSISPPSLSTIGEVGGAHIEEIDDELDAWLNAEHYIYGERGLPSDTREIQQDGASSTGGPRDTASVRSRASEVIHHFSRP